jgi:hypothetical protein
MNQRRGGEEEGEKEGEKTGLPPRAPGTLAAPPWEPPRSRVVVREEETGAVAPWSCAGPWVSSPSILEPPVVVAVEERRRRGGEGKGGARAVALAREPAEEL